MAYKMKGWNSPLKTSASGIYSPAARAARHSRDTLVLEAKKRAQSEADQAAGGSAGSAAVQQRHFKAAANSRKVKKAMTHSYKWKKQRM